MRFRVAALALILFAAALVLLPGSTQARAYPSQQPAFAHLPGAGGHPIEHRHRRLDRSSGGNLAALETSTNWAGYDATGGGFTSVTASWVEPAVPASASGEPYAVFWVGLDGDGSSTVEQTGTAAYSEGGNVYYYAWYEMYPAASVLISGMTVSPGDEMTGTVTSTGSGHFTLTLVDDSTGYSFTTTKTNTTATRYSAEVIAEAPSSTSGTLFQLADFGSVDFTACAFNGQPISAFAYNQIDMVSAGGATEAATSALGTDGASFSVTSYPGSDTTPPVTVASGYDSAWHDSPVQVTLTATDNVGGSGVQSITYSIDGGASTTVDAASTQVTIAAPADHSNDGVHTLSFYATDNAGNQETAQSATVKIDTTPPVAVASGYDSAWHDSPVQVTLAATDNSGGSGVKSITYSIDGAAPTTVATASTQVTVAAPADHSNDGVHTLSYYATDNAGNQETAQTVSVKIDTTPPTTTVSGADDLWHAQPVTVTLSASDNSGGSGVKSITYSIDGGASTTVATASTQVTVAAPADHSNDGVHTLSYYATDNAGNQEAAQSVAVKIDTTSPITVASGYDSAWHDSPVQVTLTATDSVGGSGVKSITYSIDGGASTAVDAASTQVTIAAPADHSNDGVHTLSFYATDNDGGQEVAQSVSVKIDTTSPITVASGYDSAWHDSPVQVTLTATDSVGGSGVQSITYSIDGGASATVDAAGTQVTIAAPADHSNDGVHTLSFYATDNAGNQESAQSATVKIDTTPPLVSASGAADGAWLNHATTITLSAADNSGGAGVASIAYTLDGVSHTVAGASARVVLGASPNATHTLTYFATDLAGNLSAGKSLSVHIDTVGPTTVAQPASGHKGKAVLLRYRLRDNLSPLATSVTLIVRNSHNTVVTTFKLGSEKISTWYALEWTPRAKGSYRYTVYAKDLAGNQQVGAGSATITVKKARRKPAT